MRGRARAGDTNERALEAMDDRVKKREDKVPLLGGVWPRGEWGCRHKRLVMKDIEQAEQAKQAASQRGASPSRPASIN